jgi:hypothetical protein
LSFFLYLFFGLVGLLFLLFAWSARNPTRPVTSAFGVDVLEEDEPGHLAYLPQIQQALAKTDYEFLAGRVPIRVQRRVRHERRGVALAYLSALRGDFQSLLRMARVIAVLSPEVAAVQEFERLRLSIKFAWQYEMLRMKLLAGFAAAPQLMSLSDLVSGLSARMESAMQELGERAALAKKLSSSLGRRGMGAA